MAKLREVFGIYDSVNPLQVATQFAFPSISRINSDEDVFTMPAHPRAKPVAVIVDVATAGGGLFLTHEVLVNNTGPAVLNTLPLLHGHLGIAEAAALLVVAKPVLNYLKITAVDAPFYRADRRHMRGFPTLKS